MKNLITTFVAVAVLVLCISGYATTVNQWYLNEGSGQAVTDSVGSADGVLGQTTATEIEDPAWVSGGPFASSTNSLDFTMAEGLYPATMHADRVTIDHPLGDLSSGFTIEGWINFEREHPYGKNTRLFVNGQSFNWHLSINGSGVLAAQVSTDKLGVQARTNLTGTTVVTTGTWYHVALAWDPATTQARVYLNGALDAINIHANLGYPLWASSGPLLLGWDRTGVWRETNPTLDSFEGLMSEVRLSNRMLEANELGYHGTIIPEPSMLLTGLFVLLLRRKSK